MRTKPNLFGWIYYFAIVLVVGSATCSATERQETRIASQFAQWIEQMKSAERGPFSRIRWFCKDGQVLPPKAYACAEFGGGVQHGEWSERTRNLRAASYAIANFYADLDVDDFVKNNATSARLEWINRYCACPAD